MNIPKTMEEMHSMNHDQLGEFHRHCLDVHSKLLNESNESNIAAQFPKIQVVQKWIQQIGSLRIEKINADAAVKRAQMGV